jgi:CRISPR-associated endonuclease/helicase Cas3
MERIFYIIPFTSIIDQNVKVVRNIIESDGLHDIILEHHSNIDLGDPRDDDSEDGWRTVSENWDSPIIFTTMVQFLETFFASGTKTARRMHNLANSVIILDEIQTIPVKTVHMFNEAMNFLTEYCGSTVVLCTATQPLLNSGDLKYPLKLSEDHEIIKNMDELFDSLKRVEIEHSDIKHGPEDIARLAYEKIQCSNSVLIIANTKKTVKEIYERTRELVKGQDVNMFHLSTNMCPAHRRKVLGEITKSMNDRSKTICVRTQLIEAGIDIDFNVVIRSLAGIDSIAQAAGRCNREGKMEKHGEVLVTEMDESLGSLRDIRFGRDVAKSVFREFGNSILGPDAVDSYFTQYFYERIGEMNYSVGNTSIFSMLSQNGAETEEYCQKNGNKPQMMLIQSFKKANKEFRVIDEVSQSVIVPFNEEAIGMISKLCSDTYADERFKLIRKAQQYSINTYEFDRLFKKGIVVQIGDGEIYYLTDGNYDKEFGLLEGSKMDAMIMGDRHG